MMAEYAETQIVAKGSKAVSSLHKIKVVTGLQLCPPVMAAANSKDGRNGLRTLPHPIIQQLFFSDERLLFIFAMYGLAAGLVFAVAALSEQTSIANAALYYNYPTFVTLLVVGGTMAGIEPVIQATMSVLISAGVWTLLASIFYGIFKMFKVARQIEENQGRL